MQLFFQRNPRKPSSDFTVLRHGTPYTNYSGSTSKLAITGDTFSDGANADAFTITISKGRNHGNISIESRPNNPFRQLVTSYTDIYSIYVPGIVMFFIDLARAENMEDMCIATLFEERGLIMAEVKFEIKETVGILSESAKGWTKELSLISWNDKEAKFDITYTPAGSFQDG